MKESNEKIVIEEGALMNAQHNIAKVTVTENDGTETVYEMDKNVHLILGVITVTEEDDEKFGSNTAIHMESSHIIIDDFIDTLKEQTRPSEDQMKAMLAELLMKLV